MAIHDVYRHLSTVNLTVASSAGAATSTAVFPAQTYIVRLCAIGAPTSTSGVRFAIGNAPTADSTSAFLPLGWVEYVKVTSGQKLSALGNDSVAPASGLNIVLLSD